MQGAGDTMGLVEQNGILWGLASKDAEFLRHRPDTGTLATELEQAIRSSGLYLWVGIIAAQDQEAGQSIDLYLSERTLSEPTEEQLKHGAKVLDIFDDLTLTLEADNILASLHVIKEKDCSPSQLKRRLKAECARAKDCSLIWDQPLYKSAQQ